MKNVVIKSSFFLILFLSNCKKKEELLINQKTPTKEISYTANNNSLTIKNDSIIVKSNDNINKIFFKSTLKEEYILSSSTCVDENSSWNWNISFSSLKEFEREKVFSNIHEKYKNIDFDFILYESKNDEFFFKIKNNKLYLVAYKFSLVDINPLVKIKNKNHTRIGQKEITKEKLILLNVLIFKTFNSDFVCKYRNNDKKYPFKITTKMFYNN